MKSSRAGTNSCPACYKVFKRKDNLVRHRNSSHACKKWAVGGYYEELSAKVLNSLVTDQANKDTSL